MPLRLKCPKCQSILAIPDQALGKAVRCKGCQSVIKVPAQAPAPVEEKLDELELVEEPAAQVKAAVKVPAPAPAKESKPPDVVLVEDDDEEEPNPPKHVSSEADNDQVDDVEDVTDQDEEVSRSRRRVVVDDEEDESAEEEEDENEDEEDEGPRSRRKKAGGMSPAVIAVIAGAGVLIAGGGAAYFIFKEPTENRQAAQHPPPDSGEPSPFDDPKPPMPVEDPSKTEQKKPDPPKNTDPPKTVQPPKKDPILKLPPVETADVPVLMLLVRDEDPAVRKRAIQRLAEKKDKAGAAYSTLLSILQFEKDAEIAKALFAALEEIPPGPNDVDQLTKTCQNILCPKPVRLLAIRAMEELGPKAKAAVSALLDQARAKETDLAVPAIKAVVAIGIEPGQVPDVTNLIRIGSPEVMRHAVVALGDAGPAAKSSVLTILPLLKKSDGDLKLKIIGALGKIGPASKEGQSALHDFLKNSDKDLAFAAAFALAKGGETQFSMPFFKNHVRLGPVDQRRNAISMLANLGPAAVGASSELVNALENDALTEPAKVALIRIGKGAVAVVTQKMIQSLRPNVRLTCITILAEIGHSTEQVKTALGRVAEMDSNEENQEAAKKLLERFQGM